MLKTGFCSLCDTVRYCLTALYNWPLITAKKRHKAESVNSNAAASRRFSFELEKEN